jgi:hypothetical protein
MEAPALTTEIKIAIGTPPPLPVGTRLVHIGPPKTGTTALQGALHRNRRVILAQGVRYAGPSRHARRAAEALVGRRRPDRDAPPPIERWQELAAEVREAGDARVIVSSEFLAGATEDQIRRLVDDLGPSGLHVVVTLRPLAKIIPSHWQQLIQTGLTISLDDLVHLLLDPSPGSSAKQFWWRHRHDLLIERWAGVVGIDNVTAVVVDERDHDLLLRSFEHLLSLRPGSLSADEELVNRSLTAPEAVAYRSFNLSYRAAGLSRRTYRRVMYKGGRRAIRARVPPPDEGRVALPGWAAPRIAEIAADVIAGIAASGVRIVGGDLTNLRVVPVPLPVADGAADLVPSEVASAMAMGILYGSRAAASGTRASMQRDVLARVSSRRLVRVLVRRVRARLTARVTRLARRHARRPATGRD